MQIQSGGDEGWREKATFDFSMNERSERLTWINAAICGWGGFWFHGEVEVVSEGTIGTKGEEKRTESMDWGFRMEKGGFPRSIGNG